MMEMVETVRKRLLHSSITHNRTSLCVDQMCKLPDLSYSCGFTDKSVAVPREHQYLLLWRASTWEK